MVLPAAGFGTRMGKPVAKEMLINPATGKRFIDFSLEQARCLDAKVILITRKEKVHLIEYVIAFAQTHHLELRVLEVEPTAEWPETVLHSESEWTEKNILLLPDTDWKPEGFLTDLLTSTEIENTDVVYGVFATEKLNWGFVNVVDGVILCEKPLQRDPLFKAWGIIIFTKAVGNALFKAHLESTFDHQLKSLSFRGKMIPMLDFNDRTRGE